MVLQTKHSLTTIRNSLGGILLAALVVAFSVIPKAACAQYRNQGQFQREMLITQGVGEDTGNLAIYVSFPNWFGKPGYCPVRVRVVPRKGLTFKEAGLLKVSFGMGYPGSAYEPGRQVVVDIPIEAGTSVANGEMLGNFLISNQVSRQEWLSVSARLNGRKLRGQGTNFYGMGNINSGFDCKYLNLISSESAKDDSRRQNAITEMAETGNWFSKETYVSATGYSIAYGDVRKVPSNWLCLSGVEGISIDFDDLARLDATGLECVNHYVLAGGKLSVNKVTSPVAVNTILPIDLNRRYRSQKGANKSSSTKNAASVESFESPSLDPFEDTLWDDYQRVLRASYPGRSFYSPSNINRTVSYDPYSQLELFGEEILDVGKAVLDSKIASATIFASHLYDSLNKSTQPIADEIPLPVFVSHGFGTVYLDNKKRGDHSNSFEEIRINPTLQNPQTPYVSSNRTNRFSGGVGDDFWDWLIPSVGRTPAIPFLAFVVLFVGVGTPGVMYWSTRHKRRVWLVILMPIMAAVCTIFLFSYGLLKDGFGTVARSRSLSFIDMKGNGIVWSRQSFFAATVSNQGILVGSETYFAPMPVSPYSELRCQQVDVEDSQQYVGILRPRLQTQFSISHPLRNLPIVKRLLESDPILNAPAIQNDSNFTWTKAVFIGLNKEFYHASNVAPGKRVEFTLSNREDSEQLLKDEYKTQPLTPPTDSPSADQTTLAQTFSGMFTWAKTGNSTGQISEELVWASHIGKSGNDQTVLTPGTFIVFSRDAPYLEKCVPNAREQDGLHMIIGRW